MRILLVHNFYQQYGGEETYVNALAQLLKNQGHSVRLFSADSNKIMSLKDRVRAGAGLFFNSETDNRLARVISRFKPDFTLFQNIYPLISPSAYRICAKQGVPVIQRVSNYRFMCPAGTLFRNNKICEACVSKKIAFPAIAYGCYHRSRISSFFLAVSFFVHKHILKSFDYIGAYIFPSEFTRSYYVKKGYLPSAKTRVIPTFGSPVSDTAHALPRKRDLFVYAGRLSEEKGIEQLLALFSKLPQKKLAVIGRDNAGKLKDQFGSFPNIEFKGFLQKSEVLAAMSQAQAVIMPSLWYDVLPNVLIESYGTGTPVIAPSIGVFKNLVDDNKTGRLYKPGNMNELKDILLEFKRSAHMEKDIAAFYQNNFLPEQHLNGLIQTYENIRKV